MTAFSSLLLRPTKPPLQSLAYNVTVLLIVLEVCGSFFWAVHSISIRRTSSKHSRASTRTCAGVWVDGRLT